MISSKFDDSDTIHEIIDCIYCRQITIKTLIISCQILNLIDENHFKLLGEIVSKIMDIICTNIIDYSNIDKFVKYLPYFKRVKMISGDTFTGNENNEHTNLIINDTYAILIGSLLNSDEINLKGVITLNILNTPLYTIQYIVNNCLPNSLEYLQINFGDLDVCDQIFNNFPPQLMKLNITHDESLLINNVKVPFGCDFYINGIKKLKN